MPHVANVLDGWIVNAQEDLLNRNGDSRQIATIHAPGVSWDDQIRRGQSWMARMDRVYRRFKNNRHPFLLAWRRAKQAAHEDAAKAPNAKTRAAIWQAWGIVLERELEATYARQKPGHPASVDFSGLAAMFTECNDPDCDKTTNSFVVYMQMLGLTKAEAERGIFAIDFLRDDRNTWLPPVEGGERVVLNSMPSPHATPHLVRWRFAQTGTYVCPVDGSEYRLGDAVAEVT